MTVDWRELLRKYMLAADDYEHGAGDAPWLLEDRIGDEEMAELVKLHAEVFPEEEKRTPDPHYTVPLDKIVSFPVGVTGPDGQTILIAMTITSSHPSIAEARLDGDEIGRQKVVITPMALGDTTIFLGYDGGGTGQFIRLRVTPRI